MNMKITVQSSKVVKPAYGSRSAPPRPATDIAVVQLTVFDKVNYDQHILGVSFFHPPALPPGDLELGLAEALAAHCAWAGRLGVDAAGNRSILLNDAGARLVEATADVPLATLTTLLDHPTPELRRALIPAAEEVEELILFQVTRFACGSFAVAGAPHHLVADGRGARAFNVSATRGAAMDAPVFPAHLRASVFKPRRPPRVEFEHRGAEFVAKPAITGAEQCRHGDDEPVVRRVRFGPDFIAKLKSMASAGATPQPSYRYSTVQCVAAHIWRCATKARGLAAGEVTTLRVAVDGRARMRSPPVPEGYTGNLVLWARPSTTAGELVSMPLRSAVELVSREISRIDEGYFRSFIDFASSGAVEAEGLVPAVGPGKTTYSPDVEVYSLVGIPWHDLDFGTGRPFQQWLGYLPEGLVMIESSHSGDGGIDALVCLFSRAMEAFKACCYDLVTMADARL